MSRAALEKLAHTGSTFVVWKVLKKLNVRKPLGGQLMAAVSMLDLPKFLQLCSSQRNLRLTRETRAQIKFLKLALFLQHIVIFPQTVYVESVYNAPFGERVESEQHDFCIYQSPDQFLSFAAYRSATASRLSQSSAITFPESKRRFTVVPSDLLKSVEDVMEHLR
jgi:hypothetical protein